MGIKYKVNADFFSLDTPESAYVLGYFYADGGLEDSKYIRGKYVRFTSNDRELLELIKMLMDSEHKLQELKDRKTPTYLLRIGSATLYDNLYSLGLRPNKSLTMEFPDIPEKLLPFFVRGYFDGDGCVSIERSHQKNGLKKIKRLHSSFTSGSSKFLISLNDILVDRCGANSRLYKNGTAFQLRYSTKSSITLFKYIYTSKKSLCLQRKFCKFNSFFGEQKHWMDKEIQSILRSHT